MQLGESWARDDTRTNFAGAAFAEYLSACDVNGAGLWSSWVAFKRWGSTAAQERNCARENMYYSHGYSVVLLIDLEFYHAVRNNSAPAGRCIKPNCRTLPRAAQHANQT